MTSTSSLNIGNKFYDHKERVLYYTLIGMVFVTTMYFLFRYIKKTSAIKKKLSLEKLERKKYTETKINQVKNILKFKDSILKKEDLSFLTNKDSFNNLFNE